MEAQRSADDVPVLDAAGFAQLRDAFGPSGRAQAVALVDLFATDAAEVLQALGSAVAAGDSAARSRLAHRLKGSALTLGAARLAALCGALEDAGGDVAPVGGDVPPVGGGVALVGGGVALVGDGVAPVGGDVAPVAEALRDAVAAMRAAL